VTVAEVMRVSARVLLEVPGAGIVVRGRDPLQQRIGKSWISNNLKCLVRASRGFVVGVRVRSGGLLGGGDRVCEVDRDGGRAEGAG